LTFALAKEVIMKLRAISAFVFTLLLSASSWSATEGEACDSANDKPTCSDTTILLYCPSPPEAGEDPLPEGITANVWNTFDCPATFTGTTCGSNGGSDYCIAGSGEQCMFSQQQAIIPCASGTGCNAYVTGTCDAANACTPPAEGEQFAAMCDGNDAVWACQQNATPIFDNCDTVQGTCSEGLYCIDVVEGGTCDGEGTVSSSGPYWTCAAGLSCNGLSDTSLGTCGQASTGGNTGGNTGGTTGGTTGDTTGTDDDGTARRDDTEDAVATSGFGCQATGAGNVSLGALFALSLLAIRRRRK
jgi:uncharacterized protein (TIGR03382 family)